MRLEVVHMRINILFCKSDSARIVDPRVMTNFKKF